MLKRVNQEAEGWRGPDSVRGPRGGRCLFTPSRAYLHGGGAVEPITKNAEVLGSGRFSEEAQSPCSLGGEHDFEEGGLGFSLPLQKP